MTMNTVDPFPSLAENYELTKEQIEGYQKKGHIFLKEVANAEEIAKYRPVIRDLVHKYNTHDRPVHERGTYGKAFIQILGLQDKSEIARRFVYARRFAKIAAELMGVKRVRVFQDQALYKEPGGGHTPWHQDQVYWPMDTDKTITMWMPLVPIPEEVGTMTFSSGSHLEGSIAEIVISDESHRTLGDYIKHKKYENVNYGAIMPGDATFHAGWTLHSAPDNPTDTYREVMTIIYMDAEARVANNLNQTKLNNLKRIYPELKAGDLFDTSRSHIVYSSES